METQKNEEKNIVLEMKRLLGRMMVQVDYMYRNDREMSRLDLDVLMERTRDFYDLLCDYQSDSIDDKVGDTTEEAMEISEDSVVEKRDVELEIETPVHVAESDETPEKEEKEVENDENDGEDEEDWEDEDDVAFHIEPIDDDESVHPVDDNSLAARLHRTPVTDIRNALGINDKIMIINELFKGSAERYNKSVAALNEFTTLRGARIYMSELQIELQWDVESQAYQILSDVVERRFI